MGEFEQTLRIDNSNDGYEITVCMSDKDNFVENKYCFESIPDSFQGMIEETIEKH